MTRRMEYMLGRVSATSNALKRLNGRCVSYGLSRHTRYDWGDICKSDWELNDQALIDGDRIVSVYHDINNEKFYIITEADRSATTILLPEDY